MCMAVLFYAHQHLSSSSVIRMLFPVSSVESFLPAVPGFVFTNHHFFSCHCSLSWWMLFCFHYHLSLCWWMMFFQHHLSLSLIFFLFQKLPVTGEQVLFSATHLLSQWIHIWCTATAQLVIVNCILQDWMGRMLPSRLKILLP